MGLQHGSVLPVAEFFSLYQTNLSFPAHHLIWLQYGAVQLNLVVQEFGVAGGVQEKCDVRRYEQE